MHLFLLAAVGVLVSTAHAQTGGRVYGFLQWNGAYTYESSSPSGVCDIVRTNNRQGYPAWNWVVEYKSDVTTSGGAPSPFGYCKVQSYTQEGLASSFGSGEAVIARVPLQPNVEVASTPQANIGGPPSG